MDWGKCDGSCGREDWEGMYNRGGFCGNKGKSILCTAFDVVY